MGVVEPIKVTITNLDAPLELEAADFPFAPERGAHKLVLTPELFIDASDFRMEDSKDYFGLAPGTYVRGWRAGWLAGWLAGWASLHRWLSLAD